MSKKIKYLLLFISLSVCLSLMSNTYSRYVANATGDINAAFSKWQILVNDSDINGTTSDLALLPVIQNSEHIQNDVLAPSSKGYFDIKINPENVNVSFKYKITLSIDNENIPDLMIAKYAIIPKDYDEGDELEIIHLSDNVITNNEYFKKSDDSFVFEAFTVRVYFEWYAGEKQTMTDEEVTEAAYLANLNDEEIKMHANISFEQIIE